MKVILQLISFLASFPFMLVALFFLFYPTKLFYELSASIILCSGIIFVLRIFIKIKRPSTANWEKKIKRKVSNKILRKLKERFMKIEQRSFASAHVGRVFAILVVLFTKQYSKTILITLFAFLLLIAFIRVYLKRHRVSDVFSGIAIGLISGLATNYLFIFV